MCRGGNVDKKFIDTDRTKSLEREREKKKKNEKERKKEERKRKKEKERVDEIDISFFLDNFLFFNGKKLYLHCCQNFSLHIKLRSTFFLLVEIMTTIIEHRFKNRLNRPFVDRKKEEG